MCIIHFYIYGHQVPDRHPTGGQECMGAQDAFSTRPPQINSVQQRGFGFFGPIIEEKDFFRSGVLGGGSEDR